MARDNVDRPAPCLSKLSADATVARGDPNAVPNEKYPRSRFVRGGVLGRAIFRSSRSRRTLIGLAASPWSVLVIAAPPYAAAQEVGTYTHIFEPTASPSYANGINDNGQVIGWHALVYRAGTVQRLPPRDAYTAAPSR